MPDRDDLIDTINALVDQMRPFETPSGQAIADRIADLPGVVRAEYKAGEVVVVLESPKTFTFEFAFGGVDHE